MLTVTEAAQPKRAGRLPFPEVAVHVVKTAEIAQTLAQIANTSPWHSLA